MNLIDLRNEGKVLNSYKGSAGSITGIAITKSGDKVISTSLDRTLRIHDINTKLILKKVSWLTASYLYIIIHIIFTIITTLI